MMINKMIEFKIKNIKKQRMGRAAKKSFGQCFFKNIGAWRGG